jgi:hypothetical protein
MAEDDIVGKEKVRELIEKEDQHRHARNRKAIYGTASVRKTAASACDTTVRQGKKAEATMNRKSMFWQQFEHEGDKESEIDCTALSHLLDPRAKARQFYRHDPWAHLNASTMAVPWPQQSHMVCWLDQAPFDGPPVLIPRCYDEQTRQFSNYYGSFCSFACARRYLTERNESDCHLQLMYLTQLAVTIFRLPDDNAARVAPPSACLQIYGGPYDVDTFRTMGNVEEERRQYVIVHEPILTTQFMIVESVPYHQNTTTKKRKREEEEIEDGKRMKQDEPMLI